MTDCKITDKEEKEIHDHIAFFLFVILLVIICIVSLTNKKYNTKYIE